MGRRLFVISDTHFNHGNMLKFKDEHGVYFRGDKFSSASDMNEFMVLQWNSTISPDDIVYHLGDVYFGPQKEADDILSRLRGHKRLILGNHDDGKDLILHKHFEKIMVSRIFKEFDAILTHFPVHERCLSPEKFPRNFHGHIHQNKIDDQRYINVSVECIDYTPVLLGITKD